MRAVNARGPVPALLLALEMSVLPAEHHAYPVIGLCSSAPDSDGRRIGAMIIGDAELPVGIDLIHHRAIAASSSFTGGSNTASPRLTSGRWAKASRSSPVAAQVARAGEGRAIH